MSRHDFSKSGSFIDAVGALIFALNCTLDRSRDHAIYQIDRAYLKYDPGMDPLAAVEMLPSMIEDAPQEVLKLASRLERRMEGME